MSSKRRKVSHEAGAIKDASIQAPKTKSKPQPAPEPKEPVPSPSDDDESVTIDNASGQGNGEPPQKSFQDLVRVGLEQLPIIGTDNIGRALSTPSATPVSNWDTRSPHPFKSRQSRLPCKTVISSVLQRPVAVKQPRLPFRFFRLSLTSPNPCSPLCWRPQESLRRRLRSPSRHSGP